MNGYAQEDDWGAQLDKLRGQLLKKSAAPTPVEESTEDWGKQLDALREKEPKKEWFPSPYAKIPEELMEGKTPAEIAKMVHLKDERKPKEVQWTTPGYAKQLGDKEYWQQAKENLRRGVVDLETKAGYLPATLTPEWREQQEEKARHKSYGKAAKRARELDLEVPEEGVGIGKKALGAVENVARAGAGLVEFIPDLATDLLTDPLGTIKKRGADILFVLAGASEIKSNTKSKIKNKVPLSKPETARVTEVVREMAEKVKDIAPEMPKAPPKPAAEVARAKAPTVPAAKEVPGKLADDLSPGEIKRADSPTAVIKDKITGEEYPGWPGEMHLDIGNRLENNKVPLKPDDMLTGWYTRNNKFTENMEEALVSYREKPTSKVSPPKKGGPDVGLSLKWLTREEADALSKTIEQKAGKKNAEKLLKPAPPKTGEEKKRPGVNPGPATEFLDFVDQINIDLKSVKRFGPEQKRMIKEQRGEKFSAAEQAFETAGGGQAGAQAAFGAQKGEMARPEFEAPKYPQEKVNQLYDAFGKNPVYTQGEKNTAFGALNDFFAGRVPNDSGLAMLAEQLGPKFAENLLSLKPGWGKARRAILETTNVPRALVTSHDASFNFRQGIMGIRHKVFWNSMVKQFEALGSEKSYRAVYEKIKQDPDYKLLRKGKVAVTSLESPSFAMREEVQMGVPYAEKIPIIGKGVRASARAYSAGANLMRSDLFYGYVKTLRGIWERMEPSWTKEMKAATEGGNQKQVNKLWKQRRNYDPDTSDYLIEKLGVYVNTKSGRGGLWVLERIAPELNTVLFSPRLFASRINYLLPPFNIAYFAKLPPYLRKEMLKDLFAFTTLGSMTLGIASAAGAEVGTNPLSTDFGKITIGDTRIDIWGGFQPIFRTAAQFAYGKTVSSTTGRVTEVNKGYKPLTRFDILFRFLEQKEAPVTSFVMNLLKNQGWAGKEFSWKDEAVQRLVPMVIQDIIEMYLDDPEFAKLVGVGLYAFVGGGVQTYGPQQGKKKGGW